jgi:hypothetical protein
MPYQATKVLQQRAKKLVQVAEMHVLKKVTVVLQHAEQQTAEHVAVESKLSKINFFIF